MAKSSELKPNTGNQKSVYSSVSNVNKSSIESSNESMSRIAVRRSSTVVHSLKMPVPSKTVVKRKRKIKALIDQLCTNKNKRKPLQKIKKTPVKSKYRVGATSAPVSEKSFKRKNIKQSGGQSVSRLALRRKRKDARCLQQLHIICKSVFRTKLEAQNNSSETMPYDWIEENVNRLDSREDSWISRSNSSLVGRSIIYHRKEEDPDDKALKSDDPSRKSDSAAATTVVATDAPVLVSIPGHSPLVSLDNIQEEMFSSSVNNLLFDTLMNKSQI